MNRASVRLVLALCLGGWLLSGIVPLAGLAQTETPSFELRWSAFSQGSTGAEPLAATDLQMRASLGQLGPVGRASSDSFVVTGGSWSAPGEVVVSYTIYLPLVLRGDLP